MAFDKVKFEGVFKRDVVLLGQAEKSVKELLMTMSRSVLEAHHATENIGYVNQLIAALTPVNRKVAVKFFTFFGGFSYDEQTKFFTTKSKKRYGNAKALSEAFLQDPLNNIWSWAERNIEVEQKPFNPESFKTSFAKYIGSKMQEAKDHGLSQSEMIELILKNGVDADSIIEVMEHMGIVDVKVEE